MKRRRAAGSAQRASDSVTLEAGRAAPWHIIITRTRVTRHRVMPSNVRTAETDVWTLWRVSAVLPVCAVRV